MKMEVENACDPPAVTDAYEILDSDEDVDDTALASGASYSKCAPQKPELSIYIYTYIYIYN